MYSQLETHLVVSTDVDVAYSRSLDMDAYNAAFMDATIFDLSISESATLYIDIQGSDNLQNWVSLTSGVKRIAIDNSTTPGYYVPDEHLASIAYAHIRLKFVLEAGVAGDYVVAAAGANLFSVNPDDS